MAELTCPACGGGPVTYDVKDATLIWMGQTGTVVLRYLHCGTCNGDYAGQLESAHNKAAALNFQQRIEQEMLCRLPHFKR